jgi:protein phosphatase
MGNMIAPQISSDQTGVEAQPAGTLEELQRHPLLTVRSFGLTDRGKVRDTNEDQFLIAVLLKALQVQWTSLPQPEIQRSNDRSHLFVVADGMGGRAGGETASALAIDSVESFVLESLKWFAQCKGDEQDNVLADFQRSLSEASVRVQAEGAKHPELRGMGTTLTLAYSLNDELFVAHAGDSRCYLFSAGRLQQVTQDHTVAAELIRRGALSPDDQGASHLRHVVTNALGGNEVGVKAELHQLQLAPGDTVLVCSDGLTGMVPDPRIAAILQKEPDPRKACAQLLAEANAQGGKDNITVLVARFESS